MEKETEIVWVDGEPLIELEEKRLGFQVIQIAPGNPFHLMFNDLRKWMKEMGF